MKFYCAVTQTMRREQRPRWYPEIQVPQGNLVAGLATYMQPSSPHDFIPPNRDSSVLSHLCCAPCAPSTHRVGSLHSCQLLKHHSCKTLDFFLVFFFWFHCLRFWASLQELWRDFLPGAIHQFSCDLMMLLCDVQFTHLNIFLHEKLVMECIREIQKYIVGLISFSN